MTENTSEIEKPTIAVRLPFRLLAGLIFLSGLTALLTIGYLMFFHPNTSLPTRPILTQDIVWIPGMLWLMRLGYHAAAFGRAPVQTFWPFASDRVMFWYVVILVIVFRF